MRGQHGRRARQQETVERLHRQPLEVDDVGSPRRAAPVAEHVRDVLEQLRHGPQPGAGRAERVAVERLSDHVAIRRRRRAVGERAGHELDLGAQIGQRRGQRVVVRQRVCRRVDDVDAHQSNALPASPAIRRAIDSLRPLPSARTLRVPVMPEAAHRGRQLPQMRLTRAAAEHVPGRAQRMADDECGRGSGAGQRAVVLEVVDVEARGPARRRPHPACAAPPPLRARASAPARRADRRGQGTGRRRARPRGRPHRVAVPRAVRQREPGQLLDRQQRVERDERAPVEPAGPLRTRRRPARRSPTPTTSAPHAAARPARSRARARTPRSGGRARRGRRHTRATAAAGRRGSCGTGATRTRPRATRAASRPAAASR